MAPATLRRILRHIGGLCETLGIEVCTQGRVAATVEVKITFLKPAKVGQLLRTTTQLQAGGRSLIVVSGTAEDFHAGERVAFATGTFNAYPAQDLGHAPRTAGQDEGERRLWPTSGRPTVRNGNPHA